MDANSNPFEPLLERAEQYSKTSFELLKLKSIDKTADVTSTLISRLLLTIVITLFVITLNIAVALWLGELLGKAYFGFLAIASFYCLTGVVLYFIHPRTKARIYNSIVTQIVT